MIFDPRAIPNGKGRPLCLSSETFTSEVIMLWIFCGSRRRQSTCMGMLEMETSGGESKKHSMIEMPTTCLPA